MEAEQIKGVRAAVIAFGLWGLLTLYWKQLTGLDALELIGWRVMSASVLMAILVSVTGRWAPVISALRTRTVVSRICLASVLLAVNWTTFVWAIVNDRVIETALGYFLAPLGTMALGVLVLGERLTPLKRASIVLILTAVVVMTASYERIPWVALVLAGTWSWYGLTKRQVPLDPVASLSSELFVLAVPATALVISSFFYTGGIPDQASGADWPLLVGTGAITATPLLLFAFAARRVPFTLLGPINYLVPIINLLLGWLVFDEQLPADRVVGFVLVWVALMLVTVDTARQYSSRPANSIVGVR